MIHIYWDLCHQCAPTLRDVRTSRLADGQVGSQERAEYFNNAIRKSRSIHFEITALSEVGVRGGMGDGGKGEGRAIDREMS